MPSNLTQRRRAHTLNLVIDRALLKMSAQHLQQVVGLTKSDSVARLAERIRKRSSLLAKHRPSETETILQAREELILLLYASAVP